MTGATTSAEIGMKRGRAIGRLAPSRQLDVIAEGLPMLLRSADQLLTASEALAGHPRSASILQTQAIEELAKILILIDLVRCPARLRSGRVGTMFRWFYDHLARSIYADAQSWKPTTVDELQRYVDDNRKSHSLEGYVGEYIIPNWSTYSRESQIYVDIVMHEDGVPVWNEPSNSSFSSEGPRPLVWELVSILADLGVFSRSGLDIVAEVWGRVAFVGDLDCYSSSRVATDEMLDRLHDAGLISAGVNSGRIRLLSHWQVPMYAIDFARIDVPLDELKAEREAALYAELGIHHGDY